MDLLKISAVSYLNTFPFVYGLRESGLLQNFSLQLDVPSVCAERIKDGSADLALVPVAALQEIMNYHIISDYCIGAVGEVKTVILVSKVPLDKVSKIHLDFDSRTSVELARVLARHYWKIDPQWINLEPGQSEAKHDFESMVAIGDKTFQLRSQYPYVYDLAEAWIRFTGLPFVFAVWVSRVKLQEEILHLFKQSLSFGVEHKDECLEYFSDKLPASVDCLEYLEKNISYHFDSGKRHGLELFLSYLR